jgi:hypothetical protein
VTEITITITDEVAARLAILTDPSGVGVPDPAQTIYELIDHAQQGVYRPGSWERPWLMQVFGDEWLERLHPDARPEMLSGDGRVIFDRPREDGSDEPA